MTKKSGLAPNLYILISAIKNDEISHFRNFNHTNYLKRSAKIETLSRIFYIDIIWKPVIKGFYNGFIFYIRPCRSGDIWI